MHEHAFVMLVFLNHGLELRFLLSGAMKGDTADFLSIDKFLLTDM